MNGFSIGLPEIIMFPLMAAYALLPLAFAVWVLMLLLEIRSGQRAIDAKLATIEQRLNGQS